MRVYLVRVILHAEERLVFVEGSTGRHIRDNRLRASSFDMPTSTLSSAEPVVLRSRIWEFESAVNLGLVTQPPYYLALLVARRGSFIIENC